MPKKILIATGGTGGHIYPAMGLAQQFLKEDKGVQILFVGGGLLKNRYFDQKAFNYRTISCGAFTNKSPFSIFRSALRISKGIWESLRIIKEFKPNIAIGFGSYYSFPPLLAAKLLSVPLILHEANSIPGKVNRLLAPYSLANGVHFPQTLSLVKGKNFEVGMPLRESFRKGSITSSDARKYFGLSEKGKVLLIFGGSQGAKFINSHVKNALEILSKPSLFQIVHIAGDDQEVQILQQFYKELGIHAAVKAFENHMEMAWQAADAVISRAGASSIAEQLEYEIPGILIPFARAADDHQNHNANFLVNTVGGAVKIQETELNPKLLAKKIEDFFKDDEILLKRMRSAMSNYKKLTRTHDLYSLIKTQFAKIS